MNKKFLILGFVFLFLSSFVYGQTIYDAFHEEIIDTKNGEEIRGTFNSDYTRDSYRINEPIVGYYSVNIDNTQLHTLRARYINAETFDTVQCNPLSEEVNLTSANNTFYGFCNGKVNSVGTYVISIEIYDSGIEDTRTVYGQRFFVKHALPSGMFWLLIILFILSIVGGYIIEPKIFILSELLLIGIITELIFTYEYLFNNGSYDIIMVIGVLFLILTIFIVNTMKRLIEV